MVLEDVSDYAYGQLPPPPDDADVGQRDAATKTLRAGTVCGYALILAMVFGNVISGEITQRMLKTGFDQPILIVYINHSAGMVCLPAAALVLWWNSTSLEEALSAAGMPPTRRALAWTCFLLSFLYKFNCMWTLALPHTSVSVFSAISQSSCVFVFGFSACLLGEQPTFGKGASVCICIVGVLLVAVYGSPTGGQGNSFIGVLYSVLFTLGLGLYSVLYKKWTCQTPGSHLAVMLSVIGLMGVFTLSCFWPALLAARAAGLETNSFPADDPELYALLPISISIAIFNNIALMCAICLTSPLTVSVGSLLVMPASSFVDWRIHGDAILWQTTLGCVLVASGFLLLTMVQLRQVHSSSEVARRFVTSTVTSTDTDN